MIDLINISEILVLLILKNFVLKTNMVKHVFQIMIFYLLFLMLLNNLFLLESIQNYLYSFHLYYFIYLTANLIYVLKLKEELHKIVKIIAGLELVRAFIIVVMIALLTSGIPFIYNLNFEFNLIIDIVVFYNIVRLIKFDLGYKKDARILL